MSMKGVVHVKVAVLGKGTVCSAGEGCSVEKESSAGDGCSAEDE